MGHKISPLSYRIGITKGWSSRWFLKGGYKQFLQEDEVIRRVVQKRVGQAGIAGIEIERTRGEVRVFIKAARPGFIIGRGGKGVSDLIYAIEVELKKIGKTKSTNIKLDIEELKRSEVSAVHIAQQIAWEIEKRAPFRRTMKKYIDQVMQNKEVQGVKILMSGRLDGGEIARSEWLRKGALPLQTLRADIDYGVATAYTTYGTVGMKVWVYKGKIFTKKQ